MAVYHTHDDDKHSGGQKAGGPHQPLGRGVKDHAGLAKPLQDG